MTEYDLSFVAPHRRNEVVRRIRVLDRFAAQPGRAAAERGAAELDLGVTQFYRLAGIWRAGRRPEELTGAGRPRPRRSLASPEQRQIIEAAVAGNPDGVVQAIAARAEELGRAAGVTMPSTNSIRKAIELDRAGRLSPMSPAIGADVVVATCAIDIAVTSPGEPSPTMPVATMVIDTRSPPVALGMALSLHDADVSAAARALLDAAMHRVDRPDGGTTVISIEEGIDPLWTELIKALAAAGLQVQPHARRPRSVMNDAVALLGRKPAGFRLVPGLTRSGPERRRPSIPAGASPISLSEAETLVRSRLMAKSSESSSGWLKPDRADELVAQLMAIGLG